MVSEPKANRRELCARLGATVIEPEALVVPPMPHDIVDEQPEAWAAAVAAFVAPAAAQSWPEKPVRIVNPFPAGGASDTNAGAGIKVAIAEQSEDPIAARAAGKALDQAVSKGVIHANQAANRKSAIAKKADLKLAPVPKYIDNYVTPMTKPPMSVSVSDKQAWAQAIVDKAAQLPIAAQVFGIGPAGTGKTLMALASGLTQVLDDRRYTEIIVTRATVSVGEDIGFLPGTEEEKMQPWMGAFDDNLEVLQRNDDAGEWGRAATQELIRSRIKVKSMNFMRGRTFVSKFVIIDEAQNLTPKQMKTLVTRAGPGTKIVCLGNIAQIDTQYLTEGSSGLTYVVDRFKGWRHSGHVTLARGERSRLADHAADAL